MDLLYVLLYCNFIFGNVYKLENIAYGCLYVCDLLYFLVLLSQFMLSMCVSFSAGPPPPSPPKKKKMSLLEEKMKISSLVIITLSFKCFAITRKNNQKKKVKQFLRYKREWKLTIADAKKRSAIMPLSRKRYNLN